MQIGNYTVITPFATAGSGNARWCVAQKDNTDYFLKEFLGPVQPVQTTEQPTRHVSMRRKQCALFETRKLALYDALKRVSPDYVVHVDDFFVHEGHYYSASLYLGAEYQTLDNFQPAQESDKVKVLIALAESLQALHAVGIVHADLKPEHVIVELADGTVRARLIDFDSSYAEIAPPEASDELAIDPVYLSPEAYRLATGKNLRLNRKVDTFALGILMHQALCAKLPAFDLKQYSYPYAAVLDGAALALSDTIDAQLQLLIRRLLQKHPALRPGDQTIVKQLKSIAYKRFAIS